MDRLVLTLMGFSLRYEQIGTYSDGIFINIWINYRLVLTLMGFSLRYG